MRWVLVLVFCAAVAGATWAELEGDPAGLEVEIGEAMPLPQPGDDYNRLGDRYWDVSPPVRVRVPADCRGAEVATEARALWNGRPFRRGANAGDGGGFGPLSSGQVAEWASAYGNAGETIEIEAKARCHDGREVSTTRRFELPTASCDGGPIRVFDLKGSATQLDDNYFAREVPLRPGDLVGSNTLVRVAAGGRLVLGAPECNGFRAVLSAGEHSLGGYDRSGRGFWFSGTEIVARGDQHAGGLVVEGRSGEPPRAHVLPLGEQCRDCSTPRPASYEVRSSSTRVTVRVYLGSVLVTGLDERRAVRVSALHQTSVFPSARLPTEPRLFQPGEPWTTPARLRMRSAAWFVPGAKPRLRRLAPQFARISAERLRASGGTPEQLLVSWSRELRLSRFRSEPQSGVFIWQREQAGWRRVYSRRFRPYEYGYAATGDVTGDGHPDVLIQDVMGTGACGPRVLLATAGGRVRELFNRDFCEGNAEIRRGALVVTEGVGPCPYREASAHCRGGWRTTVLRWRGAKLTSSERTVRCHLPRLDPAHLCEPRRAQPKRNTA